MYKKKIKREREKFKKEKMGKRRSSTDFPMYDYNSDKHMA